MFNKAIRKFTAFFNKVEETAISNEIAIPQVQSITNAQKIDESIDDELESEAKIVKQQLDEKQRRLLESLAGDSSFEKFAIGGNEKQWKEQLKGNKPPSNVSIKSGKRPLEDSDEQPDRKKPKWDDKKSPKKKRKSSSSKGKKNRHPR